MLFIKPIVGKYIPRWLIIIRLFLIRSLKRILRERRIFPNYIRYHSNDDRKVFYSKIDKVACTSLAKTFGKSKCQSRKNPQHKFIFTFVRNPFDRLVSGYKNKILCIITTGNKNHFYFKNSFFLSKNLTIITFTKNEPFEEFVKKVSTIPYILTDRHLLPQHKFIYKNDKCLVDYIGRFENLEKDFEPIRKKYNLEKLPHLNKTQKSKDEWKNYYTKELADLVYKRYRKDFDLWYPNAYKELVDYLNKKGKK